MNHDLFIKVCNAAAIATDGHHLAKTENVPANAGLTPAAALHTSTLRLAAAHLKAQGNLQGQAQILQLLHD